MGPGLPRRGPWPLFDLFNCKGDQQVSSQVGCEDLHKDGFLMAIGWGQLMRPYSASRKTVEEGSQHVGCQSSAVEAEKHSSTQQPAAPEKAAANDERQAYGSPRTASWRSPETNLPQ